MIELMSMPKLPHNDDKCAIQIRTNEKNKSNILILIMRVALVNASLFHICRSICFDGVLILYLIKIDKLPKVFSIKSSFPHIVS